MSSLIARAAAALSGSRLTLALTGAGISVESGIPDFRSAAGLWARYDPAEYATLEAFLQDPHKVWAMLREMDQLIARARPNPAHLGLAELERLGWLHQIITQNVDNLHQAGGAARVIEYHGNAGTLSCLGCGRSYRAAAKRKEAVPRCRCGMVLKPDVVFFGEDIPAAALERSFQLAAAAEVLLLVGTSAEVAPANAIPVLAKERGAIIIEINLERTRLTDSLTDIFLEGPAGETIPALVVELKKMKPKAGN